MLINLFNKDIIKNARQHCDTHVNCLIKEAVQVLCDAGLELGFDMPYEHTRGNQAYKLWAMESQGNFTWIMAYIYALNDEREHRYGHKKVHGSFQIFHYENFDLFHNEIVQTLLYKRLNYKTFPYPKGYQGLEICQAYRQYFCEQKQHIAKWKNRRAPMWYQKYMKNNII